jgi:hypothetical protein
MHTFCDKGTSVKNSTHDDIYGSNNSWLLKLQLYSVTKGYKCSSVYPTSTTCILLLPPSSWEHRKEKGRAKSDYWWGRGGCECWRNWNSYSGNRLLVEFIFVCSNIMHSSSKISGRILTHYDPLWRKKIRGNKLHKESIFTVFLIPSWQKGRSTVTTIIKYKTICTNIFTPQTFSSVSAKWLRLKRLIRFARNFLYVFNFQHVFLKSKIMSPVSLCIWLPQLCLIWSFHSGGYEEF